jgi:hypothetical protein
LLEGRREQIQKGKGNNSLELYSDNVLYSQTTVLKGVSYRAAFYQHENRPSGEVKYYIKIERYDVSKKAWEWIGQESLARLDTNELPLKPGLVETENLYHDDFEMQHYADGVYSFRSPVQLDKPPTRQFLLYIDPYFSFPRRIEFIQHHTVPAGLVIDF